ncbi:MAG: cell division protein FtsA, partial [Gemmatimonadetes bacterium]|nr:cell division protein FtsA [Gemmatimonadota bacterium]NIQ54319.1 cell division protein FtsA [Gemmatimonadota bacterium]NIU74529.1 cell division protein FtsA [Gammaproteobacteria bacterium]NIX44473.1 cell division protein FtsA [Gemmatimonadota bacterium]NIY08701.1 cell division protein FtsA [Gemmatimonadota bacterium]
MNTFVVAGLDIGSTKTCAVLLEVSREEGRSPGYRVLGVGQSRSGGIRRDVVTDLEETTESVREAMKEAELMAGVRADRVFAGIAGNHIDAAISTGVVAVGTGEIEAGDVDRVHEVARAVVVPSDREVLHVLPQEYRVDGQADIRDPVGMAGTRLEAEVYIITCSAAAAANLRKAVGRAGYKVEAFVHEPVATARAILTDDEREVGVALVDLGAGTTELAVFREAKTQHLATIPWGGAAITNDLVKGLSIPFAEAERAKEQYGVASAQLVDPRETVDLPGPSPGTRREVARELIAHIIEQRLDEILELAATEIERAGEDEGLGAGVVLTGGGSELTGAVDVAHHVFGAPARVGTPGAGLGGLADAIRKPRFATASGLALFGAEARLAGGGG